MRKNTNPGHNRECHKCPFNHTAQHLDTASETEIKQAREACTKCPGFADGSRKGQSWVSLDAMPEQGTYIAAKAEPDYLLRLRTRRRETVSKLDASVERVILNLLDEIRRMTWRELQVVHGLLNGKPLSAVAKELGLTKQAVSKHIVGRVARGEMSPCIAAFIREMLHTAGGHDTLRAARSGT